ncbi:hypothetical protein PACTADRAFT_48160 [Pachysolen tannophilus NRRL Y-2460]|uniref:AB hydrolase-1 domain-containing protein n=1 Tax=Pachysolen tannophilus NRRL Y-2460 TaxID=669874 RepID=A0A1E4U2Z9_PACTA|nr:hypothetical protein PACTADRAFT_48160 [Pachysolen tannophilus NRRL Y-2460]
MIRLGHNVRTVLLPLNSIRNRKLFLIYTTTSINLFSTKVESEKGNDVKKDSGSSRKSLSLVESISLWYDAMSHSNPMKVKQDELLTRALPGYYNTDKPNPSFPNLKATNNLIPIEDGDRNKGSVLNELRIENCSAKSTIPNKEEIDDKTTNLVMVHGYGSSLGWYYKNFHGLIKDNENCRIFALDLLGFGLSSSQPLDVSSIDNDNSTKEFDIMYDHQSLTHYELIHPPLKLPKEFEISAKEFKRYFENLDKNKQLIEAIENRHIDAIESWRKANNLEDFTLMGHSFGGYISLAYTLKYPERVKKLILVSPGGVERNPYAITNPIFEKNSPETVAIMNGTQSEVRFKPSTTPEDYEFLGRLPLMPIWFRFFWSNHISVFRLLQLLGPLGLMKFSALAFKRFLRDKKNGLKGAYEETVAFTLYVFCTFKKYSFSDQSLMSLFTSTIVAKHPMLDRINKLQCKTIWIFGEFDFIYKNIGKVAMEQLNSRPETNGELPKAEYKIVSKAGHNLFLDNHKEFNDTVKRFIGWK